MISPSPQVKLTLILLVVWEKSVVFFRNERDIHSGKKKEKNFNSGRNRTF